MYAARFALLRRPLRARAIRSAPSLRCRPFHSCAVHLTAALFTDTNKLYTANRLALSTDRESDIVKCTRLALKSERIVPRSRIDVARGTI